MNKEIKTPVVLMLVAFALAVGIYIGAKPRLGGTAPMGFNGSSAVSSQKMMAIWKLVEDHYVDNIDADSSSERVYRALLASLDPHSRYLSPKENASEMETIRGNFDGVGIVLRILDDSVRIAQIIVGGPSEKAGLLPGDYILAVDGEPVSGVKMNNDEVVKRLRGPKRSTVEITYKRAKKGTGKVSVVRGTIDTPSMNYSGMVDNTTGYIKLTQFSESTYDEFCEAIMKLKKSGMKSLILDLRGNGGGLMSAAVDICDELLPGRETIVYTKGAHQRRYVNRSKPGGLFAEGKLVVMIDEYSASASEIVAGAIQDNDRGIIVGRRSFGKGLVQQNFELSDNSSIMLTIARYYSPSGRCIQRPYDKGTDEYYSQFIEDVIEGYSSDSILMTVTDSTPYYTSKGRTVYGGGGIYPDYAISYKSDSNIVYYNMLMNKAVISRYVLSLVSAEAESLKKRYPDAESFIANYKVTNAMTEELFARGEKAGIARNNKSIAAYRKEIASRIKAEVADMLYGTSAFYAIMLSSDYEITEARKQIGK